MEFSLIFLVCFVGLSTATESHVPRFDLANRAAGYHGLVNEDELAVDVTPKIRAVGADICHFRIVNKHSAETPFEIGLKDRETGEAELRAKRLLNCEKKKNYKFDIAAVSCRGISSDNVTVHVTVGDVNEFAPKFSESSYVASVDEGRADGSVVQLEATDADCSPKFGDICRYEILNKDVPFTIDYDGNIRNTEPLDYSAQRSYVLRAVAYDCGMKRSDPVVVTIKVNRVCRLGWTGIGESVAYQAGSGRQDLFSGAQLELCDVPCQVKSIQTRVSLATAHVGHNCDRDTYPVDNQRRLCDADVKSVDLLPLPGPAAEWTGNLTVDQSRDVDQAYLFDGQTGAVLPAELIPHTLSRNFTIGVWLKHENHPEQDKHVKEHILCSADDHQMNRHHFSLFVRNCRLILLLRREFGDGDPKSFRPAEWRWKLPEVCDGEWHHYALSMEFPDAQLFVDGHLFDADQNNPEIIDDWPLRSSHGLDTVFTVGACWQGSENRMTHFMRGSMAGLSLLLGKTEDPDVFSCVHKCKENLEPPPMKLLQPGMELLNNNDLTELTLEGDNRTNLEVMFRQIGYVNMKEFPTPGRRPLRIQTSIVCASGRTLKIPMLESAVSIEAAALPIISLSGNGSAHHEYASLKSGVRLFPDVRIDVSSLDDVIDDSSEEDDDDLDEDDEQRAAVPQKIESCAVSVYPPLNQDHEALAWPLNAASKLQLEVKSSKGGISIVGSDAPHHYEQMLRQVQYRNFKPAYYLSRTFKLVCYQLSGRFISNELVHTISVMHPESSAANHAQTEAKTSKPAVDDSQHHSTGAPVQHVVVEQPRSASPAHAQRDQHHVDFSAAQPISDAAAVSGSSNALTVSMILTLGVLIVAVAAGAFRMRAAKRRAQEEAAADTEMAWDDTALTITVNPLETVSGPSKDPVPVHRPSGPVAEEDEDFNDSDDAEDVDDSSDDDDDDGTCGKARDLEWDNSTLSI